MTVLVICKIYISSWMISKNGGKRKVMAHMINIVSFSSPQPELSNAPRSCVRGRVCLRVLMFVLFHLQYFIDYILVSGPAYLAGLSHSLDP